jgi:hypothetical protein
MAVCFGSVDPRPADRQRGVAGGDADGNSQNARRSSARHSTIASVAVRFYCRADVSRTPTDVLSPEAAESSSILMDVYA